MEWPYRRFLRAFDAFQRRVLCEEWRSRKSTHIAALYANTNLDDERNDRASAVSRLEDEYERIIVQIWNGESADGMSEEEREAWNSPFMQAGRRVIQNALQPMVMPGQEALESLPT